LYNSLHRILNVYRLIVCCLLALCLPASAIAKDAPCEGSRPIIFGILPFVSAEQLVIRFSPLVNYLSTHLQVPVRIETAPDFIEFARRTHEDNRYDILFTAPHFFPLAQSKAGYRLIAGVDSPGMWAVIVVPVDSEIKTLDELSGKRLATVPPSSLATLLVRKYLFDNGINPDTDITMISTPSHDASLLSSYHGVTDASALMHPPYLAASEKVREKMRIIARTQSAPHIPISVNRDMSEACKQQITDLLLTMGNTDEGKKVLSHNRFSGFKKTSPEDYEQVRARLLR